MTMSLLLSFVDAERDAAWRAAMQLEMDAVGKNRT
jgi:hypothetical protein